MLQKNDLILLLSDMEEHGVEGASRHIRALLGSNSVPMETLRFVNEHRPLQVAGFYERLRKSYNEGKSPLYRNIVKEISDPTDAISTLHSFALQAFLFSKKVDDEDKLMFFKHVRAEEVSKVLHDYYADFNIATALQLLRLIKADLVAFERMSGRRNDEGAVA